MSKKNGRQTISSEFVEQLDGSPFDLLTTPTQSSKTEKKPLNEKKPLEAAQRDEDRKASAKAMHLAKERMTVQISRDTIERVKDCVYWNRLTVAQFVEEALEAALKAAEKDNGRPFQKRRSELKPSRPTK